MSISLREVPRGDVFVLLFLSVATTVRKPEIHTITCRIAIGDAAMLLGGIAISCSRRLFQIPSVSDLV